MGFKVLYDQGPKDSTSCSHKPNQAIISSTCSFEHNELSELIVAHEFNLDIYFMFFHWCYYVDQCAKFNVLFNQGSWGPKN